MTGSLRLSELAQGACIDMAAEAASRIEIEGLAADSRQVAPGYLFAAIPGARADGRDFIDEAISRGAVAILAPTGTRLAKGGDAALVTDDNPRRALALMAARFYAPQPETIAAVTGTNGKTSVAVFTRQIWEHAGRKAASLGTIGLVPAVAEGVGSLTTPDPVALHRCLRDIADAGVDHLAIEASSHGLDQFRLDGLKVRAAAFTNLSRDHLDYHATMEAYLAAKLRLFSDLLDAGGTAVLNADAPEFPTLAAACEARGCRVIDFGLQAASLKLLERTLDLDGQRLTLDCLGHKTQIRLPLVGAFQSENALAALGLALATGVTPETALEA
ncbi:MAG: UDP-N-acetylmuramoyl-L-alanyl-D-glutamate--2,6-diaminopimelate ligase, partial [Rhodovibrionaceae bacterium]|nr:UDP-N-acetylmuramoyl-L-alanyl-D-glutamate--2,6-diaminopimelate ligase [Rhodovibrionaceae bacterium]